MDPLLLAEANEHIDDALATNPALTTDEAIQLVVHGGTVHDVIDCPSRLCATVTKQRQGGGH